MSATEDWFVSGQLGINILYLASHFLELGTRVPLKVATKRSFRHEENYEHWDFQGIFLKRKRKDWFFFDKFGISIPRTLSLDWMS